MYGLLVFSSEVDDRGIDFVARNDAGCHFDVQVKTVTGHNYTYVTESKFRDSLWVCLVVLEEGQAPRTYLFSGKDWAGDTEGLLKRQHFPNAKEPEFGIHLTKSREPILEKYRLDHVIGRLLTENEF